MGVYLLWLFLSQDTDVDISVSDGELVLETSGKKPRQWNIKSITVFGTKLGAKEFKSIVKGGFIVEMFV